VPGDGVAEGVGELGVPSVGDGLVVETADSDVDAVTPQFVRKITSSVTNRL